jgi:hypothetical protein
MKTSPEPPSPCATAGIANGSIKSAITTNAKSMHFISAPPFIKGGTRQPGRVI